MLEAENLPDIGLEPTAVAIDDLSDRNVGHIKDNGLERLVVARDVFDLLPFMEEVPSGLNLVQRVETVFEGFTKSLPVANFRPGTVRLPLRKSLAFEVRSRYKQSLSWGGTGHRDVHVSSPGIDGAGSP